MQSKVTQSAQLARRAFLQKLGLVGLAAAAPTVMITAVGGAAAAASDQKRWGLLIDTAKCASGCDDCVRGCNDEHGIQTTGRTEIDAQWIRKVDLRDAQTGREVSLPMLCQHCDSAPCVDVCPTGASFKRADGIVLVNKHTCIGCRYCMMACPYNARSFIHAPITEQKPSAPRGMGTVESCTLCVQRIDGQAKQHTTACAQACSQAGHNAIVFGDLNDPDSEISQLRAKVPSSAVRADLALGTAVRYQGL